MNYKKLIFDPKNIWFAQVNFSVIIALVNKTHKERRTFSSSDQLQIVYVWARNLTSQRPKL